MDFLKLIFIFIYSGFAFSQDFSAVRVQCQGGDECRILSSDISRRLDVISKIGELYGLLGVELQNPVYDTFQFKIVENVLFVDFQIKKKISKIEFFNKDDFFSRGISDTFDLKVGDYFSERNLEESIERLKVRYPTLDDEDIEIERLQDNNQIILKVRLFPKDIGKLKNVLITGLPKHLRIRASSLFEGSIGYSYSDVEFSKKRDEFREILEQEGYWSVRSNHKYFKDEIKEEINVTLDYDLGPRIGLSFSNNVNFFTHVQLKNELKKASRTQSGIVDENLVRKTIDQLYQDRGVFYTTINIRKVIGEDDRSSFKHFYVDIKEGRRITLEKIVFEGNQTIPEVNLLNLVKEKSNTLLERGFLDINALENMTDIIGEHYVKSGFIYSQVQKPVISFSESGESAVASFRIDERGVYKLSSIILDGLPYSINQSEIYKVMKNRVGRKFDVTNLDKDLAAVIDVLRENGFYFAQFKVKNNREIVKVNRSKLEVSLDFSLIPGVKTFFGELIISGNRKTKSKVFKREMKLKHLDLVTPKVINEFIGKLRTLGIFSRVGITPIVGQKVGDNKALLNFIVKVREQDFGRGEISPGFRTDLGYKVGFNLSYNNLGGMNRSVLLNTQANLRTSYSYLEDERRAAEKDVLEGLVQLQFVEPFLFGNDLELKTSFKAQRRRYSSFDADIFSISPTLTKRFTNRLLASVRYEFDDIRQYGANDDPEDETKDNDRYIIGSITPSISYDLRDDTVRPTKGAFFNLAWEFANPYFLAQDEQDLTVNYTRAILRSAFYVPAGDITLASMLTFGFEKNYATDLVEKSDGSVDTSGFIPKIKVFRLSGFDQLRGFDDEEARILTDDRDIEDVTVDDKAFLVNFKFEPRYYLGDSSVIALFYDAGRIMVNSLKPLDLRSSVGVSFKVLTPVGSLDFDYGIKLKRKYIESSRESFGRFHLSIGQF